MGRGKDSTKFADGISLTGCCTNVAVRRVWFAEDYSPPPLLEVLQSMELQQADGYALCLEFRVVTSHMDSHREKVHPGSATIDQRVPTMADVVEKAQGFGLSKSSELDQLSLDLNDVHALYVYTLETEVYTAMNRCMRDPDPWSQGLERWRPVMYHIQQALAKIPPFAHLQLYRGLACRVEGYTEGSLVHWPAFSSTTSDAGIVMDFAGDAGTIFIIKPHERSRGRDISFLSEFEEEREVLFDSNSLHTVEQKMNTGSKELLAKALKADLENIDVYVLK